MYVVRKLPLDRDGANSLGQISKWNVIAAPSLISKVYMTNLSGDTIFRSSFEHRHKDYRGKRCHERNHSMNQHDEPALVI